MKAVAALVIGASLLPYLFRSAGNLQDPQPVNLRVFAWTDTLHPVKGTKVRIVQGGVDRVVLTDAIGLASSSVEVDAGLPVEIYIKSKNIAEGYVLGQKHTYTPYDSASGLDVYEQYSLYPPLLVPVVMDSSQPVTSSGFHRRWIMYPVDEESQYLISADVGMLLRQTDIQAFIDYYALALDATPYTHGVVIRTGDIESFDETGMALQVRCLGHNYTGTINADYFFVSDDPADFGQAGLTVTPILWDAPSERAVFQVQGTMGNGLNLILFTPESGGEYGDLLSTPPHFPPASQGSGAPGGGGGPGGPNPPGGGGPKDCNPLPPDPPEPWTCQISHPPSSSGCPPPTRGSNWKYVMPVELLDSPVCGSGGDSSSREIRRAAKGSISVTAILFGVPIGSSGGYEESESQDRTLVTNDGAFGCGQCKMDFDHLLTYSEVWIHEESRLFRADCVDVSDWYTCHDRSGPSSNYCDRACD